MSMLNLIENINLNKIFKCEESNLIVYTKNGGVFDFQNHEPVVLSDKVANCVFTECEDETKLELIQKSLVNCLSGLEREFKASKLAFDEYGTKEMSRNIKLIKNLGDMLCNQNKKDQ
jgi:hypothetical protein